MNVDELVLHNMKLAYSVAIKYSYKVSSYCDFDDAVQLCYEGLIKAAQTFDDTKGVAFSTYAYTVMRNNLITSSIISKKKQGNAVLLSLDAVDEDGKSLDEIIPDDVNIEDDIFVKDQAEILHQCLDKLPELKRNILILRSSGLTFKQIGDRLGISESYALQNYQRGLNMLRARFRGKLRD